MAYCPVVELAGGVVKMGLEQDNSGNNFKPMEWLDLALLYCGGQMDDCTSQPFPYKIPSSPVSCF